MGGACSGIGSMKPCMHEGRTRIRWWNSPCTCAHKHRHARAHTSIAIFACMHACMASRLQSVLEWPRVAHAVMPDVLYPCKQSPCCPLTFDVLYPGDEPKVAVTAREHRRVEEVRRGVAEGRRCVDQPRDDLQVERLRVHDSDPGLSAPALAIGNDTRC